MEDYMVQIGLGVIVLLVLFMIGREFVLWYLKINKIVSIMEDTNKLIKEQNKILERMDVKTL